MTPSWGSTIINGVENPWLLFSCRPKVKLINWRSRAWIIQGNSPCPGFLLRKVIIGPTLPLLQLCCREWITSGHGTVQDRPGSIGQGGKYGGIIVTDQKSTGFSPPSTMATAATTMRWNQAIHLSAVRGERGTGYSITIRSWNICDTVFRTTSP